MIHKAFISGLFAALSALWAVPSLAQERPAPVVVELFTSQSCSSCPPADEVLSDLARRNTIIALGCHVTYWDHLDWKDTLSLPACTERQRAYAAERGTRQVYTPQMVVNGRAEFVGSNRMLASLETARAENQTFPIAITRATPGTLEIALPKLEGTPALTLWLATFATAHTEHMSSGENRGRTVTYVNAVRTLSDAGSWSGRAEIRSLPLPRPPEGAAEPDGYAVLAQTGKAGPILAAGAWMR